MIEQIDTKNINSLCGKKIDSNNPFIKCFSYTYENKIIGYLLFQHIYDRIEIDDFYIEEKYRNKGFGSKLIEKVISYGNDNNIQNITLEVRKDNYNAIKIYEKYGFESVALREKYYNGIDAILMKKEMI